MLRLLIPFLAASLLPACGGDARPPPDPPAVRLTITAPADSTTVSESTTQLTGRVSPARASVKVKGEETEVTDGEFSAEVQLEEGVNVIDGKITNFYGMRNPDKLAGIAVPHSISR